MELELSSNYTNKCCQQLGIFIEKLRMLQNCKKDWEDLYIFYESILMTFLSYSGIKKISVGEYYSIAIVGSEVKNIFLSVSE